MSAIIIREEAVVDLDDIEPPVRKKKYRRVYKKGFNRKYR
jgi:hypothetical protein